MTTQVLPINITTDTWGDAINKINALIPLVPDDFVKSVQLAVPTGFSVSGGPITDTGTITVTFASGYVAYTQAERDTLNGLGTASTRNTGTSGSTVPLNSGNNTFSGNTSFTGSTMTVSAVPTYSNGIKLGGTTASGGPTDFSKHIELHNNGYGFSVTSSSLNYVSNSAHNWYNGANTTMTLSSTGNLSLQGTLNVASGGTGATTAAAARTNLGLGSLATLSPTGTANSTTFLRGDGSWQTPSYSGGTVISVDMTAPTGFTVSGGPILTTGTLTLAYASGYTGYTTTEKSKLSGIEAGATANQTDAYLLNRANHTGTLAINQGGTGATTAAAAATALGVGTSSTPRFAGIEVGHASDTTLTRASAGNLAVEGNLIYRAGGTDVAIADGGTGASTAAAARTNLGLGGAAVLDVGTTAGTVAAGDDSRITSAVPTSRTLTAGNGLTGGGTLAANRTFTVQANNGIIVNASGVSVHANNGISVGTGGVSVVANNGITVAASGVSVQAGNGITVNTTGVHVQANNGITVNSSGVLVHAGTGLTANTTGLHVDYGTSGTTACVGNDSRLSNSREWTASTVSQSEAQAGTATTRRAWTAQRVAQAIAALAPAGGQWIDSSELSINGGTSYSYTPPVGAKVIEVLAYNLAHTQSGLGGITLRLGTSGGIVTTGYSSVTNPITNAFGLGTIPGNSSSTGKVNFTLVNVGGNRWKIDSHYVETSTATFDGGNINLPGDLTTIQIIVSGVGTVFAAACRMRVTTYV